MDKRRAKFIEFTPVQQSHVFTLWYTAAIYMISTSEILPIAGLIDLNFVLSALFEAAPPRLPPFSF
jgi:hypothetical protein